jgi:multicomponent Na+:H+ antiporter subunit B
VVVVAVTRTRDLFAAIVLTGIYSLLSASIFVVLDAVDVAFTEAAVGAGISTVIFLGALALTSRSEKVSSHPSWGALFTTLTTGAILVYGTLDMPHYGDPAAPIHHHVAPRYIQDSPTEVGVPNMVTSVLASYRGYDTLGETAVIFTAGISVLLLLRRPRQSAAKEEQQ